MSEEQDDLRARLARIDPAAAGPVDPVTSPRAHELLERTMQTLDTHSDLDRVAARRRWHRPALAAAAAVAVIGIALAATQLTSEDAPKTAAPTTVALAVPGGGGVTMSSCIMFDVAILKDMPVAFGGVVTSVTPGKVVLDVDHWYKPADNDVTTVELATADGNTVALDGVEFVQGKRYLVTATDGNVNTCGYTGEATAELESSFSQAFGS